MSKYVFIGFVIAFWVLLPLGFMFTVEDGFNAFQQTDFTEMKTTPTVFDYITVTFNMLGVFIQVLFFWVPGLPAFLNYILLFMKLLSAIMIIVLIKGE